ncbi:MAG: response regulator transcription factor [Clostridiales bacterium]|nr:response regulator transcription factor [Clostridiales bacterium]
MTDVQHKILIADSDEAAAELTAFYLTQAMYETKITNRASQVTAESCTFRPDLILMESVFPDTEKFQVLLDLRRQSDVPVILLSNNFEVADRIHGLDLGADDYLAKPYDARELLARIRAVLRRCQPSEPVQTQPLQSGDYVEYPDLVVNLTNYSVLYQGQNVDMPPKELELLYFLASSPNRVFSREQLLDRLWGFDYMGDTRTVDVHIKRLREKFPPSKYWEIKTVWGIGYKFEEKK